MIRTNLGSRTWNLSCSKRTAYRYMWQTRRYHNKDHIATAKPRGGDGATVSNDPSVSDTPNPAVPAREGKRVFGRASCQSIGSCMWTHFASLNYQPIWSRTMYAGQDLSGWHASSGAVFPPTDSEETRHGDALQEERHRFRDRGYCCTS